MDPSRNKILKLDELAYQVRQLQDKKRTVALCHGCFDILHAGHLRHFEAAKDLADALVITVTPDRFVNKGPDRPVFSEDQRAELIAGLQVIDLVSINHWNSAVETIKLVRPDIFVKGQEYETRAREVNPYFLLEAKAIEEIGGKVAFTHESVLSSTAAFKKLIKSI